VTAASPVSPAAGSQVVKTPGTRPILGPKIKQYYVPVRSSRKEGESLFYQPAVIGAGTIHFLDAKSGLNLIREVFYLAEVTADPVAVNWDTSAEIGIKLNDLEPTPRDPAQFGDLPAIAMQAESYNFWSKDFAAWLYRTQKVNLWQSPALNEISRMNESERDFRIRLLQKSREQSDIEVEKLRKKYSSKFMALEEQIRRAQADVEREKDQARQQQMNTAISFGTTLLGSFLGRKKVSSARSTARGVNRSMKESRDIDRAQDTVQALQQKLSQLDADFQADTRAMTARYYPQTEQLETVSVPATKANISVQLLALGWLPLWQNQTGQLKPAWEKV
jgi:hypothetical protein